MTNFSNDDIKTVEKFLGDVTNSLTKLLSEKADSELFKELEFSINSGILTDNIQKFKKNNAVYKFGYKVDSIAGSFLILVPEEFIAMTASLVMGDDGDVNYEGSLSELEVNASLNLFESIIDDIKINFKSFYMKELQVTSKPQMIVKEVDDYDKTLSNKNFDLAITASFKTPDKEFEIFIITETKSLKGLLLDIRLMEEFIMPVALPKGTNTDAVSPISRLADVKIDILAELGRATIPIKQVMALTKGSILELDTDTDTDIRILANNLEVARAQIVVVDEHFGIKITKIISPEERGKEQ